MKLKTLAASIALLLAAPAFAAVAPGTTGNGEIFLVAQDAVNKVSFSFDTGLYMKEDFIDKLAANTLKSQSWNVGADANWTTFAGAVSALANVRWSVLAIDSTGSTSPGLQQLLTTVTQTPGKTQAQLEATIETTTNAQLTNGIGAAQGGNFFNAVNTTGTHGNGFDYGVNGSSVNYEADSGKSYFGESGGLTATLNGNAKFNSGNALGVASTFFYLTRSGPTAGGFVLATREVQSGADVAWAFNGSTLSVTAVPEPESYALMLSGLAALGFLVRRRRA